ncbi:MAG TPA: TetR/AcrR family transcriptional regulator [Solirubrobacterales bacterium]|nr:TetR/AcrR family transcriptional regulator [Solirubrobacterales bacterium]
MSADQQRRLRDAMISLVADRGYGGVTVRALTKEAGVSTRAFYGHFTNTEECLAFACESTMLCALRRVDEAGSAARHWEDGLRAAVASLMWEVAGRPAAARVVLIEAFDGGPLVLERIESVTGTFESSLANLLSTAPGNGGFPRRLITGMVAGAIRIARTTTLSGRANELPDLAPELSEWMLSMVREGATPPPAPARASSGPRREADPFPDGGWTSEVASIGDDRERIIRATLRLAAADGFGGLTIPRIRVAAGVSRRSFDSYFPDVTDCFLDSLEWMLRSAAARARAWAAREADVDRRVQRLILALCAQAARNAVMTSLAFLAILEPGREGLIRRERLLTLAAASIRGELSPPGRVPDLSLEASVAAAWEIAQAEIRANRTASLPSLSSLLTYAVTAPARSLEPPREPIRGGDRQH